MPIGDLAKRLFVFFSLRLLELDNFILPLRMLNAHSLIHFTSSLLHFVTRALHNLGWGVLCTEGRGYSKSHASSPISERPTEDILSVICWLVTADSNSCLV